MPDSFVSTGKITGKAGSMLRLVALLPVLVIVCALSFLTGYSMGKTEQTHNSKIVLSDLCLLQGAPALDDAPVPTQWDLFNSTNPNKSWCPFAICDNSPLCCPCQRRFLFVIATGRSGSTSLLQMLNEFPGVRLSGENRNHLFQMARNLHHTHHIVGKPGRKDLVKGPFMRNNVPKGAISCVAQHEVEVITPPTTKQQRSKTYNDKDMIIGFKTIRFFGPQWNQPPFQNSTDAFEQIDFLRSHFPCARVVFNIRSDTEAHAKSTAVLGKGGRKTADELTIVNEIYQRGAQMLGPKQAYLLDSTEWGGDQNTGTSERGLEIFDDLAKWLGFTDCQFSALTRANARRKTLNQSSIDLGPDCRYTGESHVGTSNLIHQLNKS